MVAHGFADVGVNVLEQPFPADQLQLTRRLRQQCPLPLAVDEASVSPADFFHYAAKRLVDYLVVKVTRSGGLWPSLQQIAVAQAAGLPMLVVVSPIACSLNLPPANWRLRLDTTARRHSMAASFPR